MVAFEIRAGLRATVRKVGPNLSDGGHEVRRLQPRRPAAFAAAHTWATSYYFLGKSLTDSIIVCTSVTSLNGFDTEAKTRE